jgi:hypothetical protein
MTDTSFSAYPPSPAVVPRAGFPIWAPGLQLMRHLDLRRKAMVLLLCTWLPVLLAMLLLSAPTLPQEHALRWLLQGRFGVDAVPRGATLGLLVAATLASLYLTVCAWMAIFEGLNLLRRGALDMAAGKPDFRAHGFGSDELGQALQALSMACEQIARQREASGQHAGIVTRSARELADAHLAMQLENLEVRSAIGEIARRTVALCGMLDSDMQDAERASADLDAIQDEERHALQLMAALRTHLLALAHRCQALGEAARAAMAPRRNDAGESIGELSDTVNVEVTQCHQLSERVGGAERMNERRIESMRRSTDSLVCRAERGMREAQQLMVLTRQIEASQAATLLRLEQMAGSCAALGALGEAPGAALRVSESVLT